MKLAWVVVLFFVAWVMWCANDEMDTQDHRIAQLEMALAQAHAEADTLEALLESLEQGNR